MRKRDGTADQRRDSLVVTEPPDALHVGPVVVDGGQLGAGPARGELVTLRGPRNGDPARACKQQSASSPAADVPVVEAELLDSASTDDRSRSIPPGHSVTCFGQRPPEVRRGRRATRPGMRMQALPSSRDMPMAAAWSSATRSGQLARCRLLGRLTAPRGRRSTRPWLSADLDGARRGRAVEPLAGTRRSPRR